MFDNGLTTSSKGLRIIAMHERMVNDRSTWESHWEEIAERVIPRKAEFTKGKNPDSNNSTRGEKRSQKMFDATAGLALERFAAAMESMLTPRNAIWHKLRTSDEKLRENNEVNQYLDEVNKILFANRYAPMANFASQSSEIYLDLGSFGTGALFIEDNLGKGLRYTSVPLEQLYFQVNAWGIVDLVHRDFELEARQAIQEFGAENLPAQIVHAAKNSPTRRFRFLHRVCPQEEYDENKLDARGMKYSSCYISYVENKIVREKGYRTFPYAVSRYTVSTKENYGRSPAMTVLPAIKGLNEMKKSVLRAGQKAAEPPLMLTSDGMLTPFNMKSGAMNAGALDAQGNELVKPFNVGANVGIGVDMMQEEKKTINDAFLVSLFQILVETPQMTATEAMLRAQEKGALLAPTQGRQQSEFLGPCITREIDILAHAGAFPPMPQILMDMGGAIEIQYEGPMMQAQKAGDGVAVLNTIQAITPLAQIDPSVLDDYDLPMMGRILAESNGLPAKAMLSKEAKAEKEAAKAQQAQAAQLLEAAPVAASAAKDIAQAQSLAASSPNQVAPNILGQ